MSENNPALTLTEIDRRSLRADCKNCFGFCCVALCFSATDGFPANKNADSPCENLDSDFRCTVHKTLKERGLKGCIAYECFGAGQKVAQATYNNISWRQHPESAEQMFKVFLIMQQIHEMVWYLTEALTLQAADNLRGELIIKYKVLNDMTSLKPDALAELTIETHRSEVNDLLLKASELVRNSVIKGQKADTRSKKARSRGADLIGADLRKKDLRAENFRGAYLIAADLRGADLSGTDFIGADLRDADIRGADLSKSIFLTQAQVNTAKGDENTKLPKWLTRPVSW